MKPTCERCGVFLESGTHCEPCAKWLAQAAEKQERESREMSAFPISRLLIQIAFFAPIFALSACIALWLLLRLR